MTDTNDETEKREPLEIKSRSVITRTPEQQQEFDNANFLTAANYHIEWIQHCVDEGGLYRAIQNVEALLALTKDDAKLHRLNLLSQTILRHGDGSERLIP